MNSLSEHTNLWFVRPNTRSRPKRLEDFWVFASLVSLLGPASRSSDLRSIHGYFTYLLLGCDPYTGKRTRDPEPFDSHLGGNLQYSYRRLLNFEQPTRAPRWDLLTTFFKLPDKTLLQEQLPEISERLTVLTLALTLVEKPIVPDTLLFVKNCIELYQRSLSYSPRGTMEVEFLSCQPMLLATWIRENIDLIFKIQLFTTDNCLGFTSYVAWFANLIRIHRTFRAGTDRRRKTFGVIDDMLNAEVDMLKKKVESSALTVTESSLLD